jgi:glucose/mannose-6-phosphate isomerase
MILDDLARFHQLDTHNLRAHLDSLPDQFETAWTRAQALELPASFQRVARIVIVGMGGSALAGELLAALVADSCNVPILVHRGYDLPAYVDGQSTLVIAITYSGTTEETLSALELADARGTQILLLTANKTLAQKVEKRGAVAWMIEYEGESRVALGTIFGLLAALVNRLGLVSDLSADAAETVETLRSRIPILGTSGPTARNPAKRLAGQLIGRIPAIYGAGILSPVAHRWKMMINQNAKAWAQWDELPELNHNSSTGITFPRQLMSKLSVVILSSPQFDHPRVALRQTLTKDQYLQQGIAVDVIKIRGHSRLGQILAGIQYGDYVSYYVAMCYEVDPMPMPAITELKDRLLAEENVPHDSHD